MATGEGDLAAPYMQCSYLDYLFGYFWHRLMSLPSPALINSEKTMASYINISCITCNQNFVTSQCIQHLLPAKISFISLKGYINTQFGNFGGCQATSSCTNFLKMCLLILTSSVSPNFSYQWAVGLLRPLYRR